MKITFKFPESSQLYRNIEERKRKTIEVIYKEIENLITGRPLTKEEQRRHPFSRKNFTTLAPLVHIRTGNLARSFKKDDLGVKVNVSKAPYVDFILKGTSRMIPRDFVQAALKNVQDELKKIWET